MSKQRRLLVGATWFLVLSVPGWTQAGLLWGIGRTTSEPFPGSNIYAIDPSTGAILDTVPYTFSQQGNDLDFLNGQLYAMGFGGPGNPAKLFTVDTTTGISTQVGTPPGTPFLNGLAADQSNEWLYTVNPGFSNVVLAVDENFQFAPGGGGFAVNVDDLTYDAATGQLYAFSFSSQNLLRINPTTGAVVVVGNTSLSGVNGFSGLALDTDTGTLYGTAYSASNLYSIYRIDPTNANATLVAALPSDVQIHGLAYQASAAVPEPGSWTLLGLNTVGLIAYRRRNRTQYA